SLLTGLNFATCQGYPFMALMETAAGAALKIAAERISAYLKSAQERRADHVGALRAYTDAARDAILALEAEFDEIIVEAEFCNLQSADDVTEQQQRITRYLTVDLIRPLLQSAEQGLRRTRNMLQNDAKGFFGTEPTSDRLFALSRLTTAVEA